MVLEESEGYYVQQQTSFFCTFLDATKAFDRLLYGKLFRLQLGRQLPAHIRVLLHLYTNNFVRARWCDAMSDYSSAADGIKQVAVLCPVLLKFTSDFVEISSGLLYWTL